MWQYRYTDELYHYGVKGMKWGRRKRQKYDELTRHIKRKHSSSRYEEEARDFETELKQVKKRGYKKFAEDNGVDGFTDKDKRDFYNEYVDMLSYQIKDARRWADNCSVLSERIDSIDTSSMSYKKAVKLVHQYENDWINENNLA